LLAADTCKGLAAVYLHASGVGDGGAVAIADALATNAHLVRLDLRGNGVGDVGASQLAYALSVNGATRLEELRVDDNPIGMRGALAWAAALRNHAVMAHLAIFSAMGLTGPSGNAAPPLTTDEHAHYLALSAKYGLDKACPIGSEEESCHPPCALFVAAGLVDASRKSECDSIGKLVTSWRSVDASASSVFIDFMRSNPTAIVVRAARLRWGREAQELASTAATIASAKETRESNMMACPASKVVKGKDEKGWAKDAVEAPSKTFDNIGLSPTEFADLKVVVSQAKGVYLDPSAQPGSRGADDDLKADNTVLVVAMNGAYLKCKRRPQCVSQIPNDPFFSSQGHDMYCAHQEL
jgi:hypothetical protein